MFKERLISGIILVVLAVIILYLGGYITLFTTLALSIIGLFELYRTFKLEKTIIAKIGYLSTIVYYLILGLGYDNFVVPMIIIFFMILMSIYVFAFPKYNINQLISIFFGFFYATIMLSYVYSIRILESGGVLVVLIFFSAWGNDTCAYCVGKLIGKHKMTPKLSPKKTYEGLVGGIVGAGLLGLIYGIVANNMFDLNYNAIIIYPIICLVCAFISVVGDLTASAIKRNNDIKDYGKLIPGHGGVLDRFDSIIFTAPIVYYLIISMTNGLII